MTNEKAGTVPAIDPTISVALTFDFDAMSSWVTTGGSNNPSMISRGEFGVVGVDRVLGVLRRHEARGTFFVPGHTILAFPDIVKRIRDDGHELGHHGWAHENPASFDRAGEREVLELAFDAFDTVLNARPVGYRSPAWDLSPDSVSLLLDVGIRYDSSCMAGDYYPYYLRTGDAWSSDVPYRFGPTSDLVEMPVSWALDDFPHFELIPGVFNQLSAPSKVYEIWRGEYDYMRETAPGGLLNLTMHPESIGRGHRIPGLVAMMDHMAETEATFEPLGDYVDRWVAKNLRGPWEHANPDRTGKNSITQLPRRQRDTP